MAASTTAWPVTSVPRRVPVAAPPARSPRRPTRLAAHLAVERQHRVAPEHQRPVERADRCRPGWPRGRRGGRRRPRPCGGPASRRVPAASRPVDAVLVDAAHHDLGREARPSAAGRGGRARRRRGRASGRAPGQGCHDAAGPLPPLAHRASAPRAGPVACRGMETPPPDPAKLLAHWMEWERGETPPGRVMSSLKTGRPARPARGPGGPGRRRRRVPPPMGDAARSEWPDAAAESREALDQPHAGVARPRRRRRCRPRHRSRRAAAATRRSRVRYNARPGGPPPWADLPRRPAPPDGGRRARPRSAAPRSGPPVATRAGRRACPARPPSAVLAPIYDDAVDRRRADGRRPRRADPADVGPAHPPGRGQLPGRPASTTASRRSTAPAARPRRRSASTRRSVEIIGELDHLATVSSGSEIVPFVGALPGRPDTTPNPAEVEAVLHVPLAELLDPAIFREEIWTFPGGYDQPITFFELVGDTVWGATALAAAPAARRRHRHPRPRRPRPPRSTPTAHQRP